MHKHSSGAAVDQEVQIFAYQCTGRVDVVTVTDGVRNTITIEANNVECFMEGLRQAYTQTVLNKDTALALRYMQDGVLKAAA